MIGAPRADKEDEAQDHNRQRGAMYVTRMLRARLAIPAILAASALAGCDLKQESLLAPTGSSLSLAASDTTLAVNSATTITVQLHQTDGSPVPDKTEIVLAASVGQLDQQKVRTERGQAVVTYKAAATVGTARVRATSAAVSAEITLAVVSSRVQGVSVKAEPAVLPPEGGRVSLVATVTGETGAPVVAAPVVFETTTGTLSGQEGVTTDAAGQARVTLETNSTATVTARVADLKSDGLEIRVRVPVNLVVRVSAPEVTSGDTVTFTAEATTSTGPVTGGFRMVFGDGEVRELGQASGTVTTTYAYPAAGGYNASMHFATPEEAVRETVRVTVKPKPPPPPPPAPPAPPVAGPPATPAPPSNPAPTPPAPAPPPPPSGGGRDEIDLRSVTFLHADVSDWAVTSRITRVSVGAPPICIEHTKAGKWAAGSPATDGNPWIFANINGRWYAATYEWLKAGQTCKNISRETLGPHTKKEPIESWRPRSGEIVGFMVSRHARDGYRSGQERSNVVLVRWP
jgi:hypothetical protein